MCLDGDSQATYYHCTFVIERLFGLDRPTPLGGEKDSTAMVSLAAIGRKVGAPILLGKERMQSGVSYNLLSTAVRQNPYPVYDEMREKDPVHFSELAQAWFLTRYADVAEILSDRRFSVEGALEKSNKRMGVKWDENSPFMHASSMWMLMIDPPDHTRLRGLINRAFTPRAVEQMRATIQQITDELLDKVQDQGRMDAVHDFGDPLPILVFTQLLGLEGADYDTLKRWANTVGMAIDPIFGPEWLERIDSSAREVREFFQNVIAERKRNPTDDLLSGLIQAEEAGEKLSEEELLATCLLLLVAGTETTSNLIGNSVYALMRNRDQFIRLQREPKLLDTAVEEFLRYETPVQLTGRVAKEDVELGGKTIRAGQPVGCIMGAANRDPEQYPNPSKLDLGRVPNRHTAFSFGPHFCVGSPLARLEGQIAIGTMVRRMPNMQMRMVGAPQWRDTLNNRGLKTLPVIF